jgi:hypothetical protein
VKNVTPAAAGGTSSTLAGLAFASLVLGAVVFGRQRVRR